MAGTGRKSALALLIAGALVAGGSAQAKPKMTGEEQLAKALEGRVAGDPVDCITLMSAGSSRIIDHTAIIYGFGNTIYVQKPKVGLDQLTNSDVLVTKLTGSQLCSIDTVQLHDRTSGFWRGFLSLDKFVPYKRVPKAG